MRCVFIKHFAKGSLQYPVIFSFNDTLFDLIHLGSNVSNVGWSLTDPPGNGPNPELGTFLMGSRFPFVVTYSRVYLALVVINKSYVSVYLSDVLPTQISMF